MAKKTTTKTKHDTTAIRGLFILGSAIAYLLSVLSFAFRSTPDNWIGIVGYSCGHLSHALFGLGSYLVCSYFLWIGWRKLWSKPISYPYIILLYFTVFLSSFCILLSVCEDVMPTVTNALNRILYPNLTAKHLYYHLGGAFFYYIYRDIPFVNLLHIFNTTGVILLCGCTFMASLLFLTKTTPAAVLEWLLPFFQRRQSEEPEPLSATIEDAPSRYVSLREPSSAPEMLAINPDSNPTVRPSLSQKRTETEPKEEPEKKESAAPKKQRPTKDFTGYRIPAPALLTNAKKVDQSSLKQDLRRQAEVLEETLLSFGIEAKVGQINCGPTITSFEVHPSIGVKVQKIKTLENDIALNMEAKSIRIIAPIPGKAAVGIEVPNPYPQEVGFKEMLVAYQQNSKKFNVPILLGKTVTGEYVMNDLTKMPHCIIAGATGSGKSVCINTIIISILMNARPDEIKLIMVDPKKVELTPYTRLPHMLAPVITEPQGACAALNWLVKEMENRYDILKQLGVRNIDAFNHRTINKELEASLDREIPAHLPYIVVIIDELADLMMVSSNDIETPIARIAQMARAVGIHLILATQRPSREVITGLIKANFPTRISFKVASRVNSQIILDEGGAEALLGNGDMLFLPPGTSTLIRAQGAFIRDEDINSVVKHICEQAPPNYAIASFDDLGKQQEAADAQQKAEVPSDSLYDQAEEIVRATGNASTTFLQRKLKIGYARAASLMDELEAEGVIAAQDGGKGRKVIQPKTPANEEVVS